MMVVLHTCQKQSDLNVFCISAQLHSDFLQNFKENNDTVGHFTERVLLELGECQIFPFTQRTRYFFLKKNVLACKKISRDYVV